MSDAKLPAAKRRKIVDKGGGGEEEEEGGGGGMGSVHIASMLPSELWALALEYLPFHDVLSFSTASKWQMQVLMNVTRIHVFNPSELHIQLALRLSNVEKVYVCCLLKRSKRLRADFHPVLQDQWSLEYCLETQNKVLPFLSHFPKIKYTFLGAIAVGDRNVWDGKQPRLEPLRPIRVSSRERNSLYHRSLIHQFSGAMGAGCLRKLRRIDGLFHIHGVRLCSNPPPRLHNNNNEINGDDNNANSEEAEQYQCVICTHVMKNFPPEVVLQAFGQGLCIPVKKRLQHVIERGGRNLIAQPKRLKDIFSMGLSLRGRVVSLDPFCLAELQAMKDLELKLDIDSSMLLKVLKKIKIERTMFPRNILRDLSALGCSLTAQELQDEGFSMCDGFSGNFTLGGLFEHIFNPLRNGGGGHGIGVHVENGLFELFNDMDRDIEVVNIVRPDPQPPAQNDQQQRQLQPQQQQQRQLQPQQQQQQQPPPPRVRRIRAFRRHIARRNGDDNNPHPPHVAVAVAAADAAAEAVAQEVARAMAAVRQRVGQQQQQQQQQHQPGRQQQQAQQPGAGNRQHQDAADGNNSR